MGIMVDSCIFLLSGNAGVISSTVISDEGLLVSQMTPSWTSEVLYSNYQDQEAGAEDISLGSV